MYSSSPRSTPTRRQSSAIEHIPFSTNLSHLSAELARTDSAASSPCRSDVSFGSHSFREQEHQKKSLEEENFKLKLRVYMLEERLQRQDSNDGSIKALAELKVQSAALREELAQKSALLRRASETLEALEQRQSEQQSRACQEEAERALLEDTLEELEAQYRAELDHHQATEAERSRLEAALRALQTEQRRAAAARAVTEAERAQQERDWAEERSRAEQERSRLQEELRDLQARLEEEARRGQRLAQENARLETLAGRRSPQETSNSQEPRSAPAAGGQTAEGPGSEAEQLRRQLAAVASERRLEKAMAAAALQLQLERVRSLQASVQTVSEQLRRGQTELAECRAERDGLLLRQRRPSASLESQAAASSTEGVEVIPEPSSRSESREDLLQGSESPGVDLATWLGSMPRLRSESLDFPAAGLAHGLVQEQEGKELEERHEELDQSAVELRSSPLTASPAPLTAAGPMSVSLARCDSLFVPPTADNSDWETWSEPDRSVSRARIGLERSSLEPPPAEATTDTDTRTGRSIHRHSSTELRELEGRIEGLRHVRDGLWAEVAICQKLVTGAGDTSQQQGVTVPVAVLEDVQQLHRRLEDAVAASGRLRGRREAERRSPPPPELTLALTITQEQLAESTQQLSAAQQRAQRLRSRLQLTRDRLQLAEHERQQLQQQRDEAAQQLSRLSERLEQTEAERARLAEAARRQPDRSDGGALRRLQLQLQRSEQRQQELEQLVRQLSAQLRQLPTAGGGAAAAEQRVRHAEQQLLQLGRQRLRVQTEIARLRSRARLLHSRQSVHESQRAEAEAEEAAAALAEAAGQSDHSHYQQQHQQHQQQLQQCQQSQQRRRRRSSNTPGPEESRLVRELTEQLEKARAQIEKMRANAHDYDEAGHSCPESTRSCELPLAPSSPGGPRLSSHSESDPLEPLRTSCGQPAYSSPDLGIESDCQRCSSRTSSTTVLSQRLSVTERTPLPSGGEATPVAGAGAGAADPGALASTRAALHEALSRLSWSDYSKTAQSAACRRVGQFQLLSPRTRGALRRPVTGAVSPAAR
ncbi:trichohyalin-like isoform X2 [Amphibalanus amphitrite]|uniref:trichohyalin-like isoform X2 n=1 Tax=Amphibalanus amphitrite TaxID=1232801 RepID=UPI001C91A2D7|nr:trichohyalin-like isoform X2 [Amphibalanus amphitrite]